MDGGAASSLPSWWRKAALSLGAATVLAIAVQRLRQQKEEAASAVRILAVVAAGDSKAAAVGAAASWKPSCRSKVTLVDVKNLDQAASDHDVVAIFCSDVSKYFRPDMALFKKCLEKLVPGGALTAQLDGLSEAEASGLEMAGLFAGAVEGKASKGSTALPVVFSCRKPGWAAGATTMIPVAGKIDEDALLGEVPAPTGKGKSDCSTAPKACANCSCGRKELEDKHGTEEAKKLLENGKVRSDCGSCYLGDAFRCAGCPYRGQPAFKPGSKVELGSDETEGTGQLAMNVGSDDAVQAAGGKMVITA